LENLKKSSSFNDLGESGTLFESEPEPGPAGKGKDTTGAKTAAVRKKIIV
jgi:hypothetical protein